MQRKLVTRAVIGTRHQCIATLPRQSKRRRKRANARQKAAWLCECPLENRSESGALGAGGKRGRRRLSRKPRDGGAHHGAGAVHARGEGARDPGRCQDYRHAFVQIAGRCRWLPPPRRSEASSAPTSMRIVMWVAARIEPRVCCVVSAAGRGGPGTSPVEGCGKRRVLAGIGSHSYAHRIAALVGQRHRPWAVLTGPSEAHQDERAQSSLGCQLGHNNHARRFIARSLGKRMRANFQPSAETSAPSRRRQCASPAIVRKRAVLCFSL